MKCEDIFTFVCICLLHIAGAISYSIPNPIYPSEVGILYLVGWPSWGGGWWTKMSFSINHLVMSNKAWLLRNFLTEVSKLFKLKISIENPLLH